MQEVYSNGHEGYKRYRRSLPGHVRFRYKRENVRAVFGLPKETSNGGGTFYGVPVPAYDLYHRPDVTLHFQYHQKTGGITLITLMPASWTPEHTMKHKSGYIQDKIR